MLKSSIPLDARIAPFADAYQHSIAKPTENDHELSTIQGSLSDPPLATKFNSCRLSSAGPGLTINIHGIHRSRQHGKLPTAACPGELLVTHSGIVNESREILIIRRPQPQLIVHADAPTIRLPRRIDKNAMVDPRGGERGLPNIWDRGGLGDDAGFPALRGGVVDDVFWRDVC